MTERIKILARSYEKLQKILRKLTTNLRQSYETLRKVSKINLRKSQEDLRNSQVVNLG